MYVYIYEYICLMFIYIQINVVSNCLTRHKTLKKAYNLKRQ